MRVLLSAFACEPHVGSEPEVGWQWAVHLAAQGHDTCVLTRQASRNAIEAEIAKMSGRRPCFVYYDEPTYADQSDIASDWALRAYYVLWQWRVARLARELHDRKPFDRVHHVTYAGLRAPSFMGSLGVPFVFGPVGGGERAPFNLRAGYSLRGWTMDALRDVSNLAMCFNPLTHRTLSRATTIYVTSQATMRLLPTSQRAKASIELAIACDVDGAAKPPIRRPTGEAFRVLYVGQFLHLKGMHLGLPAFAKLLQARPTARLTMIGEGPEGTRWRRLAERLGVAACIEWIPWLRQDKLADLYASHDVLLFPSLHDPGGMVVLESMAHGLPVVCLNIGGPGIIVTPACGRVIDVMGRSKAAVVASLAQALIELADPRIRNPLAEEALQRRKDFSWKAKIAKLYGPLPSR